MTDTAWRALAWWLLLPGLGIPLGLLARRHGHRGFLERLGPWCLIVALVLGSAYAGPPVFGTLLAAAGGLALAELASLQDRQAPREVRGRLVVAWAVAGAWLLLTWRAGGIHPGILGAGVLGPPALVRVASRDLSPWWRTPLLANAVGAGLAAWLALSLRPAGFRFVLFAFSVVAVNDILAFVGGRFVPRGRPFPGLSPNKTWSGYAAGFLGAVGCGFVAWFAVPEFPAATVAAVSAALALAGDAGDLLASALKRRHGVKDFGRALGAQGGMLDRLDSLIGAGWVFYLFVRGVGP